LNCGYQTPAQNIEIVVLLLAAFNVHISPDTLVVVAVAVAVAAVRTHCFGEDIAVAASAGVEAGCTAVAVVVAVDIAVAASAGVEAGCTAAFAAGAEAGCTDLGAWEVPDWMKHCHCCCHCHYHYHGFARRHFALQNVVGPREPVGSLRGQVLAEQGLATKS